MAKGFFPVLLLLVFPVCMFAQKQARGRVLDAERETPLDGAVVTILEADSLTVVAYTLTDEEGRFQTVVPSITRPFLLRASLLGYASRILPLSDGIQNLTILLHSQSTLLKEIRVKPPAISQRNDTISYHVASFADRQDQNIGDVLKRLPGIDVQDDGSILYNGKAINKFYIEGLDLLNERYGLAVNNIAPRDIESVELLEGHQPVRTLKDTRPTDRAALNLVLKNSSKARWLGHAAFAGGLSPALWKADELAMKISGKSQSLNLLQSNNTGEDIVKQLKPHTLEDYLEAQESQPPANAMIQVRRSSAPIDEERWRFNRTFLGSTNNLRLLRNDYQLRSNLSFVSDRLDYSNNSVVSYFSPAGARTRVVENTMARSNQNDGNVEVVLNKNTNNFYLNNKLSGQLSWDKTTVGVEGSSPNEQKSRAPYHDIENVFNFIKVYGRSTLKVNSLNRFGYRPESLGFSIAGYSVPFSEFVHQREFMSRTNIALGTTISKWTVDYRAGVNVVNQTLRSAVFGGNTDLLDHGASFNNALRWRTSEYYVQTSAQFVGERTKFNIALPLEFYHTRLDDMTRSVADQRSYYFLNPSLSLIYKLSPLWSFSSRGQLSAHPLGIEYLNEGFIYSNYRNVRLGNEEGGRERRQNYTAALTYRSPVKALFVSFSGLYSGTIRDLITERSLSDYLILEKMTRGNNERNFWNFSGRISKGFDEMKSTGSLLISYQSIESALVQDTGVFKSRTRSFQLAPKFTVRLDNGISLEYASRFASTSLTVSGRDQTGWLSSLDQRATASIVLNKKLSLKAGLNHIRNEIAKGRYLNAVFGDLRLQYLSSKHMRFNIDLVNVFNKKTVDYNDIGTASYTSNVYQIRPLNVVAGLKFDW